jgi:hypothetical protein
VRANNATHLTVYIAGQSPALTSQVNALLGGTVQVTYVSVPYSAQQLEALAESLNANLSALAADSAPIAMVIPDVPNGTDDVILQPSAVTSPAITPRLSTTTPMMAPAATVSAAQATLNADYGTGRFTIEPYTDEPLTPSDGYCPVGCRFDDYSAFYGGDSVSFIKTGIGQATCSTAFAVKEPNGRYAVLSAGHCQNAGQVVNINCDYGPGNCPPVESPYCGSAPAPTYCPVRELGTIGTYDPPTENGGDYEAIDVPSGDSTTNEVYGGSQTSHYPPIYTVNGEEETAGGICCVTFDGAVSGEWTSNPVYSAGTCVNYAGMVCGLGLAWNTDGEFCIPGDSGGPVYAHESNYSDVLANGVIDACGEEQLPVGANGALEWVWVGAYTQMAQVITGGSGLSLIT